MDVRVRDTQLAPIGLHRLHPRQQARSVLDLRIQRTQHFSHLLSLLRRFVETPAFDRLTKSRERLDSVAGIRARSVDAMLVPVAVGKSLWEGHGPLRMEQDRV